VIHTIYADPPWHGGNGCAKSFQPPWVKPEAEQHFSAVQHYPTMSIEEIKVMEPFIRTILADPPWATGGSHHGLTPLLPHDENRDPALQEIEAPYRTMRTEEIKEMPDLVKTVLADPPWVSSRHVEPDPDNPTAWTKPDYHTLKTDEIKTMKTILADPPWGLGAAEDRTELGTKDEAGENYSRDGLAVFHRARPDRKYPTMPLPEIKNMADWVKAYCDKDCYLFMWAVSCMLEDALEVMKAWGFRYVTNICWTKMKEKDGKLKLQSGIGYYVRGSHELLLLGKRGHPPLKKPAPGELEYRAKDESRYLKHGRVRSRYYIPSVIVAERTKHSRKPIEAYDVIEKIGFPPYLELFARHPEPRKDWFYWGNEVDDKGVE